MKYDYGEEKISKSGSKYWNIECRYQDFDGKEFGDVSIELRISKFRGVKRIDLLEAFPLQYHPQSVQAKAELVQNGQKFVSLIGSHFRHYNGTAFYMDKGLPVEFNVDGRVMIDAAFFQRINPNYSRLKITEPADSIPTIDFWDILQFEGDNDQGEGFASDQVTSRNTELDAMTEDDYLVCCPTVLGFSLANKQWGKLTSPSDRSVCKTKSLITAEFAVADIEDIQWSSDSFDGLVIPDEDRDIIMALVEARNGPCDRAAQDSFQFDDIITGKGRGLNILLQYDGTLSL